ncbi:MAG: hypothetical protein AB1324_05445 [Candidatus Micrarchaeota archaeon]
MEIPKCSNCGMPLESSNYYARGMTIKCRHCNHSALPLVAGACFYNRIKKEEQPREAFNELDPQSLLTKLSLALLFVSVVSAWAIEMKPFTIATFAGFLALFAFSFFLRLRSL